MRDADERRIEEVRLQRRRARQLKQRKRRRQQMIRRCVLVVGICAVLFIGIPIAINTVKKIRSTSETIVQTESVKYVENPPDFTVDLLEVNEYSRPGTALEKVNGVVIHWTANPGTTAEQNRSYFANLAETKETYASSHFVIGLSGEIIQCIPCNEIAYASNDRNVDTISIECCIPGEDGKFNDATYDSLVWMVSWLVGRYDLTVEDVIRHYDVTGKDCPKYFVDHEDAWIEFKQDVRAYIETNGIAKTEEIK